MTSLLLYCSFLLLVIALLVFIWFSPYEFTVEDEDE